MDWFEQLAMFVNVTKLETKAAILYAIIAQQFIIAAHYNSNLSNYLIHHL